MASFNRVILVGNLTRDLELRYTPSQLAVTDLGLAVNDKRKNAQGEWVEETTFVDVTLWGRTAEVACEYLRKGSNVLIEGRLTPDKATGGPRIWTKQDGSSGSSFEVTAGTVRFLSSRGEGGEAPMMGSMEGAEIPAEDDIPF